MMKTILGESMRGFMDLKSMKALAQVVWQGLYDILTSHERWGQIGRLWRRQLITM